MEPGVELDMSKHMQAGVRTRDVVKASAESVTRLNVFHRLGDRQVCSLSPTDNRKSGGGAEE
jgi:hypothetical protein